MFSCAARSTECMRVEKSPSLLLRSLTATAVKMAIWDQRFQIRLLSGLKLDARGEHSLGRGRLFPG